jgi:hypothetical protein
MSKYRVHSDYLYTTLDTPELAKLLADISSQLAPLSFTGVSGTLVAPPLALALNKGMIVVRKEGSHSKQKVEGLMGDGLRYLIVDDFMESGETVERIIYEIKQRFHAKKFEEPTCVGIVMYRWTKGQIDFCIRNWERDSFPIKEDSIKIGMRW